MNERIIGVVGLGYVGLPVAVAMASKFATIGFDINARRIEELASGSDRTGEVDTAELRAANTPVFLYFTADWCLTCKVNERGAMASAEVAAHFQQRGIKVLVGDWTDGDPALGRFIEKHNRAGVPLYLWYPKGAKEPKVLPQVLTQGMLAALPGDET